MIEGQLIRRYKRFLADILLDSGEIIVAYCCNTGKLLGVPEGARVLLTDHGPDTHRKLRYTWECFYDQDTCVGINTHRANTIVEAFLASGQLSDIFPHTSYKREVKYGSNSRIDFLLTHEKNEKQIFLEIKSVHMKRGTYAVFPDCPTERGAKHLSELSRVVTPHTHAAVLYLVQRDDCDAFSIASDIDPIYSQAAIDATLHGVNMHAISISHHRNGNISYVKQIDIIAPPTKAC